MNIIRNIKTFLKEKIRWFFKRHHGRHITVEGFLFIIATFMVGFASFNTGDNSLYMMMSVMLSFLIFSGILSTTNLKKLDFERIVPKHISAKENTTITIKIKNAKRFLSTYSAEIEDFIDNGRCIGTGFVMKVPRKKNVELNYLARFQKRGIYKAKQIKISSRFPFGFFERSLAIDIDEEITVYPEIIDISKIGVMEKSDQGDVESGKKGTGADIYGLREYEYGDNARHIHWKITAKLGMLMVKEFEKEERKKVSIILLNQKNKFDDNQDLIDKFEKAVVYAASFAYYFIHKDYQVEILTLSGNIPFGSGSYHLLRILRALTVIDLVETEDRQDIARLFTHIEGSSRRVLINSDSSVNI